MLRKLQQALKGISIQTRPSDMWNTMKSITYSSEMMRLIHKSINKIRHATSLLNNIVQDEISKIGLWQIIDGVEKITCCNGSGLDMSS